MKLARLGTSVRDKSGKSLIPSSAGMCSFGMRGRLFQLAFLGAPAQRELRTDGVAVALGAPVS